MNIGFSFNGVHCTTFGLEYIPNEKDMMPFLASYKMQEEAVTGRHGGYYYGETVGIQTRKLECFFEDMTQETMEGLLRWMSRGSSGKLIFDDRPEVYYEAIVSAPPAGEAYVRQNQAAGKDVFSGKMTLQFSLYCPYGHMTRLFLEDGEDDRFGYANMLPASLIPPEVMPEAGTYLIYNPGTQPVSAVIEVAGEAPNGISMVNYSTGDACRLVSLPPEDSGIVLDGNSGEVKKVTGSTSYEYAFEYHDQGFISLKPSERPIRNVDATYTSGSNVIKTTNHAFRKTDEGWHIHLNGKWVKIQKVNNDHEIVVNGNMDVSGNENTILATMNEIRVDGTDMSLSKLHIGFIPLVR